MEPEDRLTRSPMHCDGCGRTWFSPVAALIVDSPLAHCACCGGTLRAEPPAEAAEAPDPVLASA